MPGDRASAEAMRVDVRQRLIQLVTSALVKRAQAIEPKITM